MSTFSVENPAPSVTITFRTEGTKRDRLDEIAEGLDRNRNWVLNEAIDAYIALHQWQADHIKAGMASQDLLTTDEVRIRLAQHQEARHKAEANTIK